MHSGLGKTAAQFGGFRARLVISRTSRDFEKELERNFLHVRRDSVNFIWQNLKLPVPSESPSQLEDFAQDL